MDSKFLLERVKNYIHELAYSEQLVAAYLYGSKVKYFKSENSNIHGELDLLIVSSGYLKPGNPPINKPNARKLFFKHFDERFGLTFNGIIPPRTNKELYIDIVGDGKQNILEHDPHSKLTSFKPKYLIWGIYAYKHLSDERITRDDIDYISTTMINYVKREFFIRDDNNALQTIAKTGILLASLLNEKTLSSNNKEKIVKIISEKYPSLETELNFLLDAYKHRENLNKQLITEHFLSTVKKLNFIKNNVGEQKSL